MCILTRAARLDFTGLLRATLPLSIWGNSQLFYKIGHLSTLVMLPVDSADIATAQKKFSLEKLLLDKHASSPRGSWSAARDGGLRTSLLPPSQQECHPEMEQLAFAYTSKPIRE